MPVIIHNGNYTYKYKTKQNKTKQNKTRAAMELKIIVLIKCFKFRFGIFRKCSCFKMLIKQPLTVRDCGHPIILSFTVIDVKAFTPKWDIFIIIQGWI